MFGVLVTLDKADPARLRPGVTVGLEMVLGGVNHAVMVPTRAVFKEKQRSLVYLAQGGTFERVPVTTGMRNDCASRSGGDPAPATVWRLTLADGLGQYRCRRCAPRERLVAFGPVVLE
ncbi:MAG: hypothetical protein JSV65_19045 [Armatimonadota bacterium]|nr:MAG: hypothetical protein JSV65_19045 [Armatimonadota bacterium]